MANSFDTGIKCPKCDGTVVALLGGPAMDEVHEWMCPRGCTHDKGTAAALDVQVVEAAQRYVRKRDRTLELPCYAHKESDSGTFGPALCPDVEELLRVAYVVLMGDLKCLFVITAHDSGDHVQTFSNYAAVVEYLEGQGYDTPGLLTLEGTENDQADAAAYALGFPDHPIVPKVDAAFDVFGALQWPHIFQPVKLIEDPPDYEKLCETLAGGRNVNPLMRAFRDLSFDQTYQDEAGNVWDISDGKINLVRCAKCNAQGDDFPYEPGVRRHNSNSVRPTMRASEIAAKLYAGINQHKDRNPKVRIALTGDAFVEITEGVGVERLRVVSVTAEDHGYPLPEPGNTTVTILLDMDDEAAKEATAKAKAEQSEAGVFDPVKKFEFTVDLGRAPDVPVVYDLQAWREQVFNPYPDRKGIDFGQGVQVVYEKVDSDDQGAMEFEAAHIGKVYRSGDKRDQGMELGEGFACFMRHTLAGETVDVEIKTEGRTWLYFGMKMTGRS